MPTDYIPPADPGSDAFQSAFRTYVNADLAALGLAGPDVDVTAMNSEGPAWDTEYPAHLAAQSAASAAKTTKDARRATYESVLRRLAQRLQESLSVDDTELAAMGLTLRDTIPTEIADPTTRPVGKADTSQRLQISLRWTDEGTPTSKAKPFGVVGCNIFMKLDGPPPGDLSQCQFIGFAYALAVHGGIYCGTGEQNGTLHSAMGWYARRRRPDQRDGQRDRAWIRIILGWALCLR